MVASGDLAAHREMHSAMIFTLASSDRFSVSHLTTAGVYRNRFRDFGNGIAVLCTRVFEQSIADQKMLSSVRKVQGHSHRWEIWT